VVFALLIVLSYHQSTWAKDSPPVAKQTAVNDSARPVATEPKPEASASKADDADFYKHRAADELYKGHYDHALADVNKAIRLRPDDPVSYYIKAAILESQEEDAAALVAIDYACKTCPQVAQYWQQRATILSHLGRMTESIAASDKAIRLDDKKHPNVSYHRTKSHTLRSMNRLSEAMQEVNQCVKLEPDNFSIRDDRSRLAMQIKRYDTVISDCTYVLVKPERMTRLGKADVLRLRASAYIARKQYEKAVEDYQVAVKQLPDDRSVHAELFHLYNLIGNKQDAEKEQKILNSIDVDLKPPR